MVGNQAMAQAKRDTQPNAEDAPSLPGHRHVVAQTRGDQAGTGAHLRDYRAGATRSANATRLSTRLSCGRDEIGERDDVVLVVAGTAVVGPAAGDQPQPRVVDVAVHQRGGEPAL